MTNTIKFNKTVIENLDIPEKRTKFISDEVKGLYLDVTPRGTKSFRLGYKYNTYNQTYTIGRFPDINPTLAVNKAKELRALITQGINPQIQKAEKKKEDTFKSFLH